MNAFTSSDRRPLNYIYYDIFRNLFEFFLYLSDRCSVLLSNKFSDISPHINYSDMLFDGLFHILQVSGNPSGILSDILSDKYSDIVSDILFDIYSDTFPDILFDTLPGSLSDDSDGFSGSLYL